MARSHGKVLSSIWQNEDFCSRSERAQLLYFKLISQPRLTLAGALDLMPARWSSYSGDATTEAVSDALNELEEHGYVAVDHDTLELVVRTHTRYDLEPKRLNKNLVKGLWTAWSTINSARLRTVVVQAMPDELWEAVSPSAPPAAVQNRRSARLEPPVATTSSNHPSEPPVETTGSDGRLQPPSPSPSTVTVTVAAAHGEADPGSDRTPSSLNPVQRSLLLREACAILADRKIVRRGAGTEPGNGYRQGIINGKAADYHDAGHAALVANPNLTAEALADLLEPPSPKQAGATQQPGDREAAAVDAIYRTNQLRREFPCPAECGDGRVYDEELGATVSCTRCGGTKYQPGTGYVIPDEVELDA